MPFALALLALALGPAPPRAQAPSWEVLAVRYAVLQGFPVAALVAGADTSRRIDAAMSVWVLRSGTRTVLVDAGFHRERFRTQWRPVDYVTPAEALAASGIAAASVTDIVISHVHWDHADGIDLFPNARVWIQAEEYEHYVGPGGEPRNAPQITAEVARVLGDARAAGRVELVAGDDQEILPGVRVYTGGRHTHASQYVGVNTARGTVVLASDNMYLYENLDRRAPIAQTLDAGSNLAAQDRMRRLASAAELIIPGHDPLVFDRFPTAGGRAVRIAPAP